MILTNGDVLTIGDKKYLIVETARFEEEDYIFVNKLNQEEDFTDEYFVMKKTGDGVILITEEKVLNVILPVFSNKIQKVAEKINNETKYEI